MTRKLAFAVLVSAVTGTVWAGGESSVYQQLDVDEDGYISPKEGGAIQGLVENWEEVDMNQDGRLDQVEFARFEAATAPRESAPLTAPQETVPPGQ